MVDGVDLEALGKPNGRGFKGAELLDLGEPDARKGGSVEQSGAEVMREKALNLRCAGYSYGKIATALGVHESTVYRYVSTALEIARENTTQRALELREIAHQRHERAIQRLWPLVTPAPIKGEDGKMELPRPDMQAVDRVIRIIQADAALMGYTAPQRHQIDVRQLSISASIVVEKIAAVLPDDAIPLVYKAVEEAMLLVERQAAMDANVEPGSENAA